MTDSIDDRQAVEAWPPSYTVVKHPRARHVKLRTSQRKGLELIVPPRFNLKNIPTILLEHKAWIVKQLSALQSQQDELQQMALPDHIVLRGITQEWKIHYLASNVKLRLVARPHQELVLLGDIKNKVACKQILTRWVRLQAKKYLPIELKRVSELIKLPFQSVTIRDQQTRWGSCSADRDINLNYKLLFLPHSLMKHVLIHELAHTKYLDHSEKFWQLVARHDENWEQHKSELRKANQFVPQWL